MAKLKNAGFVLAALVLAGTGTLPAQDTSYTPTPVPADTFVGDKAPVGLDTGISDTASDTLSADTLPSDKTADSVTTERPYDATGEAAKPKHHEEDTPPPAEPDSTKP